MKIINTEAKPIKMWLDDIEDGAVVQAKNLANLPFLFKHVAIMPDSHQGYGMPIGGVIATQGVIIPNAVGVDIGCGMCAIRTTLTDIDKETLKKIMGEIRKVVPVGFNHQKEAQDESLMPQGLVELVTTPALDAGDRRFKSFIPDQFKIIKQEFQKARYSLGTLGAGNHFIEIQKGSDGFIWIMIHSGSRNLGKTVADYYNKIAVELNEKWHSAVPKEWQLAFLPIDSDEGQAYIREMNYCVEFALANRRLMMKNIESVFRGVIGGGVDFFGEMINIAHNYAQMEHHFKTNVMVHRKGATLATQDTIGIIPGSQGTKSYIVKGKGNADSFNSCSHGAGRLMSRTKAQSDLVLADEIKRLDDLGVIHGLRYQKDLDEAPSAYKPIDVVMANQIDLVEVLVELSPLAVIKA